MFDKLPYEIMEEISKHMNISSDLLSLKLVSKEISKIIKKFHIMRLKVFEQLKDKKRKELCANNNCYDETEDLFIDYYREYEGRYIHYHQDAMNYDTIYINQCEYKTFSPYCHECFKKYILLNGLCKNRIRNILVEGFVDIEIL